MKHEQLEGLVARVSEQERVRSEVTDPLNAHAAELATRLETAETQLSGLFKDFGEAVINHGNSEVLTQHIKEVTLFEVEDDRLGPVTVVVTPTKYSIKKSGGYKVDKTYYDLAYGIRYKEGERDRFEEIGHTSSRDGLRGETPTRNIQASVVGVDSLDRRHAGVRRVQKFKYNYLPGREAEIVALEAGVDMLAAAIQDEERNPHIQERRDREAAIREQEAALEHAESLEERSLATAPRRRRVLVGRHRV